MFVSQTYGRMACAKKDLSDIGKGTESSTKMSNTTSSSTIPVAGNQQSVIQKLQNIPKIQIGKYELQFDPTDLDEEFAEKARLELRETPEVVAEALKEIRVLLSGDKDLVVPDEDEFYQKYLRPCKWYPESAYALLKRFYRFRADHPKITTNLLPSNEKSVFSNGILLPLPIRTKKGERVILIESGSKWNPKKVSLEEIFKGTMLALDAAMAEPKTQVAGAHVLLNMDGLSLSQVTYFTPSYASMVTEWIQKCLPARLKGIHVLNQPFVFNMVFALFKPFLTEKIRKRMHFHGRSREKLLEYIDAAALPKIFGGDLDIPDEPFGDKIWQHFCEFEEDFRLANKYGYVSKK